MKHIEVFKQATDDAEVALVELKKNENLLKACCDLTQVLIDCFQNGGKVLICGNGGSHCDALHFAEEFTGRYRKDRRALPVIALGEASHVTCVANDYGFQYIFERQVDAFAKPGDVVIGISTSGNSENVKLALEKAKEKGAKTAAFLGKDGGKIKSLCDLPLIVPGKTTDRIQELHMMLLHTAIEAVERVIFPENYS